MQVWETPQKLWAAVCRAVWKCVGPQGPTQHIQRFASRAEHNDTFVCGPFECLEKVGQRLFRTPGQHRERT
jgi:hypothetical protein